MRIYNEERWAEALRASGKTDHLIIADYEEPSVSIWTCENCDLVLGTEDPPPCQRACPLCSKVFTLVPELRLAAESADGLT